MTTSNSIRFGEVDLISCEREPIHIPGSIQPHGLMLVVDLQEMVVLQFAGNTLFLLGILPHQVTQLPLHKLFRKQSLALIVDRLRVPAGTTAPSIFPGLSTRTSSLTLDASVHVQGDFGIIELEPARGADKAETTPLSQVKSMLAVLQATDTFEDYCQAAATQVRLNSGYDRVMIYQFLHDGSGKVIAEDKADGLEGYLGKHYPASDIPPQAREIYRRNWLRIIPDINYTPVPLTPLMINHNGRPLDMTYCALRSVSPIHLEYLRNMGVTATMAVSIVLGEKLWGLIVCHHYTPHYVAADLRMGYELFAQIFSLQLEARIAADTARRRMAVRHVKEVLAARLITASNIGENLLAGDLTLLDLISAGGVAVWLDGKLSTLGQTPPAEFIVELVNWLNGLNEAVISTFQLGALYPPAIPFAAIASGLLAISLPHRATDYVIWFRPEIVSDVIWAGDPHKPVEVGPHGDRLTPRKSFEVWQETVREQSVPWDEVEIEAVHALRVWLLENVLLQVDLARQQREATLAYQSMLMAELDHRVKNILANIQALVRQTKSGAQSVEAFALSLERRIRAMAHAHGLMAETHWKGASLRALVEEELAPYVAENTDNIRISGDDVMLSPNAALPFILVVHELVTNAAKYGALSTPDGCVEIGWHCEGAGGALVMNWQERNGPPVKAPKHRGFGSVVIERSLRHEIKGTCKLTFNIDGVGCIISIPAKELIRTTQKEMVHV